MPTKSVFSASMVALFISLAAPASARAGAEDEVRDLFGKFVVAQNAHDLNAVKTKQSRSALVARDA